MERHLDDPGIEVQWTAVLIGETLRRRIPRNENGCRASYVIANEHQAFSSLR